MVLNATSNNISGISWQSVLLVEGTGVPGENHLVQATHNAHLVYTNVHFLDNVIINKTKGSPPSGICD